jgi:excinuclease UvrABC helicase subunit UvrB
MLLRSLRHKKDQYVKHLQHRQVRQQAQHLDLDQADHVQVTIHLLQHRVHRALVTIHLLREVLDHVQAAA